MFETCRRDPALVRTGRARFFQTLPASLLAHGLAFGLVPLLSMWTVTFPTQSPMLMTAYSLTEPPPAPPPPPPAQAPPKAVPVVQPKPNELPPSQEIFAPQVIPDVIPVVTEVVSLPFEGDNGAGVVGGIEGGLPGGVVGGTTEGMMGGDVGGKEGGEIGSVDSGRVVVPRDATLRMHALSKTYPSYPERARIQRWEDQLVVRYVIGTNGRVKEVIILDPAHRKIFDEAAVNAIRHWRFRPMIKDGIAMEVEHELTVYFKLTV